EGGGDADRRRAADHQRPDCRPDLLPALVGALDLALREHGLVDEDQPVGLPANGGDGGHDARVSMDERRLWTSARPRPAISTILARPWRPLTTLTDDGGTSSARARSRATAAFAAPATGAAVTRSRRVVSRQPTISSRDARGWTWSDSRVASALAVVLVLAELGRHHAVVALERGAEVLDELAPYAAQGLDLAPDPCFLGAALLDDLLAAQLGLAHLQLRLLARRRLHLVAEAVGRDQRLLQRPLALVEAARTLLERGHLLLQLRVLLQHRLVVLGHVVEERVDLVDVEPAKPAHAELLLANIERTNAHETSDVLADLGGESVQHRDQESLQKE